MTATDEQKATKRQRAKKQYVLQHDAGDGPANAGDWEYVDSVKNKAAACKYVRDKGLTGRFRTIAIIDEFEAAAEQKTVVRLSR